MAIVEESRYPTPLSAKLQNQIEKLVETTVAEVPEPHRTGMNLKMRSEAQELVKGILAEVSEMYREGLTQQVALLTKENQDLKERLDL
jgi:hypothetical protein